MDILEKSFASVDGTQICVEGVAIAAPLAITTITAAANILSRFILLSFSSLILNGDKMKTPLVPLLHVLLKLTVVRNNNRHYQS
ncbi:MAG: hypothetical protein WCG31_00205 [Deltaproteobacteria bacterium]